MAELQIEDSELVLHLSSVEKMEGLHGDVRLPLSSVTSAHSVDDVWQELRACERPARASPARWRWARRGAASARTSPWFTATAQAWSWRSPARSTCGCWSARTRT